MFSRQGRGVACVREDRRRREQDRARALRAAVVEALESRQLLTAVTTFHNDNYNGGANTTETQLTIGNVNTSTFGKQFSTAVDGQVYSQPLYVPGINITTGNFQGTHNVIYATTEHDSVYAIDANGGNVLWKDSLASLSTTGVPITGATSVSSVPNAELGSGDISPEIGITGTPVIDQANGVIYVIAKTKQIVPVGGNNHTHYVNELFKLSLANGAVVSSRVIGDTDTFNGYTYRGQGNAATDPNQDPFVFGSGAGAITVGGQSRVYFNSQRQMSRPGAVLQNGILYTAWASHGDNGPYHGWMLAYRTSDLALVGVYNTTPNGSNGGIWQGGASAPMDTHLDANGNPIFYFETGNGTFDGNVNGSGQTIGLNASGFPSSADYGDSFVKLGVDTTTSQSNQNSGGWGFKVLDYFSPSNNHALDNADRDLGSAGPLVLPDSVGSATHPHLLVGSGKEGKIYLIDRDNMGKFDPNTDHVVQEQAGALSGLLNAPAFYNNTIYFVPGYGGQAVAYPISNGVMATTPSSKTPDSFGYLAGSPSISANGTTNGIMWTADKDSNAVHAYNASNLASELWTSNQAAGGRDTVVGTIQKFQTPTVADGIVIVGSSTSVIVYGPPVPPTSAPVAPSNVAASALTYKSVQVTWQDNSTNEDYFSIQRSNSPTGPFTEVGKANANSSSFTDTNNVLSQTTYYYKVVAHNTFNGSSLTPSTNVATVTTPVAPPIGTGDGLRGEYFNDPNSTTHLSGTPVLVRVDPTINYSFTTSPGPGVNNNQFSIRWTGRLQAQYTDTYTIYTESDDGVMFKIKPVGSTTWTTLITNWTDHGQAENTGTYAMSGGQQYDIEMDYYQGQGGAISQLLWSSTQTPKDFIPQTQLYSGVAPAVPSNVTVTPASSTQLNVQWSDNSNIETGYVVERTNPDQSVTDFTLPANTTSYMDTALTPDTVYSYKIKATNFQADSAFTTPVTVSTPVAPPTPTNAKASNITMTSISLSWQLNSTKPSNKETGVNILRRTGTSGNFVQIATLPAGTTSYVDNGPGGNGLTPGTLYDYHVQAFNVAGYSDFTGVTTATLTEAPTGLAATGGAGVVNLTWSPPLHVPDDGVTYNVYRSSTSNGQGATPIATGLSTASFSDVSATPGVQYYYKVTATDRGGESGRSAEANGAATASALASPTGVTATPGAGQVTISWTGVGAATSYRVYRGTSSGSEGATPLATNVSGTSFVDTAVSAGQTYFYQVTAVDASANESARSNEPSVTLAPGAVTGLTGQVDQDRADIDLTWKPTLGATSYDVYRGTSPGGEGSTPYFAGWTDTMFIDYDAARTPGVSYYYTVVASNAAGYGPASAEVGVATPPSAPNMPTIANAQGSITLQWAAVAGATSYNVYRGTTSAGEGSIPLAINVTGTSYVDASAAVGTKYYYQISAVGVGGEGFRSGEASATVAPPVLPSAPSGTTAQGGVSQVTLNWSAVAGATSYRVFRATAAGGEGSTPYATGITSTTWTDAAATNGTKYYYTVMANNGAGQGPAGSEVSATPLAAPSVSAFQVNDGSAQRSKVSTITISFGQSGITYSTMAAAFTVTRRSDGATFAVTGATATADGKGLVLSFTGDAGVDANGLPDGRYDLIVHGAAMQNANQSAGTGDQTFTFTRLFGDVNGDGTVNNTDYFQFKNAFNASTGDAKYNSLFDWDDSGTVDNTDYFQFKKRFNTSV